MPYFYGMRDQMGNEVFLKSPAKRIVSLVPSLSELLWDLGLQQELVGITRFCVNPPEMNRSVGRVGGTKKADLKRIIGLRPDLIIGNKEENNREQIEKLQELFPVYMSDVSTLEQALEMIGAISELCGRAEQGGKMLKKIGQGLAEIEGRMEGRTCAYLMWKDPYMVAAGHTFIHAVLEHAGFRNVFGTEARYPVKTLDQIREAGPDVCLLSTEPFPFGNNEVAMFEELLPRCKVRIADGEMLSWYGSRLLRLPLYIRSLHSTL